MKKQVLDAFEIAERVYSLRPPKGTRRVTIRHQQVRACNLVHALFASHALERNENAECDLCIVGAGVAGTTAASMARRLAPSARVRLLERQEVDFWNLRLGHTRWLHPHWFLWPEDGWDRETTILPVNNWRPGYAEHVARQIECDVVVSPEKTVERVRVTPQKDACEVAYWCIAERSAADDSGNSGRRSLSAGTVILADGLGLEKRDFNAVNSSYWLDDNLHREEPYLDSESHFCIVGNGDGALTDLLRVLLAGGARAWGHREIIESVLGKGVIGRRLENGVRQIEDEYTARLATLKGDQTRIRPLLDETAERYRALVDDILQDPDDDSMRNARARLDLRVLTRVTQVANTPFGEPSFPVHRLLRTLVDSDERKLQIRRGRAEDSARLSSDAIAVHVTTGEPAGQTGRSVDSFVVADRLVWRVGTEGRAAQRLAQVEGAWRDELDKDAFHLFRDPKWPGGRGCRVYSAVAFHPRRPHQRLTGQRLRIVAAYSSAVGAGGDAKDAEKTRLDFYPSLVLGHEGDPCLETVDDRRPKERWLRAAPISIFYDAKMEAIRIRRRAPDRHGVRAPFRIPLPEGKVRLVEIAQVEALEVSHHDTAHRWRMVTAPCRVAVLASTGVPRGRVASALRRRLFAGARLIINFTEDGQEVDDEWFKLWEQSSRWPAAALAQIRTNGDSSFVVLGGEAGPCVDFFEWSIPGHQE